MQELRKNMNCMKIIGVDESRHTFRHNLSVSIKLRAGEEFLTLRLICRLGAIVRG